MEPALQSHSWTEVYAGLTLKKNGKLIFFKTKSGEGGGPETKILLAGPYPLLASVMIDTSLDSRAHLVRGTHDSMAAFTDCIIVL